MALTVATGDVLATYPYLWLRQRDRGETEGRKPRPVCVVIAIKDEAGFTHLALLAITSQAPRDDQRAVELPLVELRQAGLSSWKRAWVIVSEFNYDVLERSYYIGPQAERRSLSSGFMNMLLKEFRPTLSARRRRIDRR